MKGLSATTIVIFSVLLLVSVNTSQFAFADGMPGTFPPECGDGPTDESGGSTTINVDPEFHISGICIKTGNGGTPPSFPEGDHSNLITVDGTYGQDNILGCFEVSGLLTNQVTVTDKMLTGCMATSHVDYVVEPWDMVGGYGGITQNTALLVSGSYLTASWMIPLLVSAIGIGVFVFTRK
jgi:hypothetical protein